MFETMWTTRRTFLKGLVAAGASPPAVRFPRGFRSPSRSDEVPPRLLHDRPGGRPTAGLDGVEVRVATRPRPVGNRRSGVRQRYKDQMKATGLTISSLMMGLLNSYPLASDPRGPAWLDQSIEAAKDLGAGVVLWPSLAREPVGERAAQNGRRRRGRRTNQGGRPQGQAAGVILGIENTLSAQQNAEILDRIGHESVRIYYDVGNSTNQGYDVAAEIRFLKDRIAIFHFKTTPTTWARESPVRADRRGDSRHRLPRLDRPGNLQPGQRPRGRCQTQRRVRPQALGDGSISGPRIRQSIVAPLTKKTVASAERDATACFFGCPQSREPRSPGKAVPRQSRGLRGLRWTSHFSPTSTIGRAAPTAYCVPCTAYFSIPAGPRRTRPALRLPTAYLIKHLDPHVAEGHDVAVFLEADMPFAFEIFERGAELGRAVGVLPASVQRSRSISAIFRRHHHMIMFFLAVMITRFHWPALAASLQGATRSYRAPTLCLLGVVAGLST